MSGPVTLMRIEIDVEPTANYSLVTADADIIKWKGAERWVL